MNQRKLQATLSFIGGVALVFYVHHDCLQAQWDLEAYLEAARAIRAGENPYPLPDENKEVFLTNLTIYVYPPLFARLLSPIAGFDATILKIVWLLLQCIAFESLYWLGLRLLGRSPARITWLFFHALALLYDGVNTDMRAGNTALIEASILTAWAALHLSRPVLSGMLLGWLAAVKPLVVFVLIRDLVCRNFRPLLASTLAILLLYGFMQLDGNLFSEYRTFLKSRTFQRIMDEHTVGIYNSATVSVGFRLFTDQTLFKPLVNIPLLAYLFTFGAPIGLWLLVFSTWRKMEEAGIGSFDRNRLGFFLLLPTVLLTIPRVADYTLVWLLVPLFFGGWEAWEKRMPATLMLFGVAALIGNLPVRPSRLVELTYSYHLLHYRYVSLVLFWCGCCCLAWGRIRRQSREKRVSPPADSDRLAT